MRSAVDSELTGPYGRIPNRLRVRGVREAHDWSARSRLKVMSRIESSHTHVQSTWRPTLRKNVFSTRSPVKAMVHCVNYQRSYTPVATVCIGRFAEQDKKYQNELWLIWRLSNEVYMGSKSISKWLKS